MRKAGIAILILVLMAAAVGIYLWNKPHRNYQAEASEFSIPAQTLIADFQSQPEQAKAKYHEKVFTIKGVLSGRESNALVLNNAVFCRMAESAQLPDPLPIGDSVKIKGRVTTFNELFGQVELDNCLIQE